MKKINHNYFNSPTIENCYWAGFIAADGCINQHKNGGQSRLVINLMEKDLSTLEKLHKKLNLNNKLYKKKSTDQTIVGKSCNINLQYALHCYSNKICDDLEKIWNITPRKTNSLKPPNIYNIDHIKSFLIGVIDGDGSIYHVKARNCLELAITGNSIEFLNWCKSQLCTIANIKDETNIHKCGSCYAVRFTTIKAAKILSSLKEIKVSRLKRKWKNVKRIK